MEIIAALIGVMSVLVILALGLIILGQKIGTWRRLTNSEKMWQRKVADMGFNYVMPAGIVISVALLPLIIFAGVAAFVVMLFI